MKNGSYTRMGLFLLALVVVGCECGRVKRQDLIPSPRVGKRTLLRTPASAMGGGGGGGRHQVGGVMGGLLEDLGGMGVLLEEEEVKKNTGDSDSALGSSVLLPSAILKFFLDPPADSSFVRLPSSSSSSPSLRSRLAYKQRKSSSSSYGKIAATEMNPRVTRILLQRLASLRPEEVAQYLGENLQQQAL